MPRAPAAGPSFAPRQLAATRRRAARRPLIAAAAAAAALLVAPAAGHAAVMTFGSPLSVAATRDTAQNLSYRGTDIPTISNGQGVVVHVNHDGADTALWNANQAHGTPVAPAAGQVLSLRLKGCAQPAPGGATAPLTQIHFQDLTPTGGDGVRVNVTSQAFDIPVCGHSGAGGDTVTTYHPTNLCVNRGDFVNFNDEGGFDAGFFPSGVHYQVIGAVVGSKMQSFIRGNGTNNGATFSPRDTSTHDGFASNPGEELLLQATLATGPNATPLCPGGTHGQPGQPGGKPALFIGQQTDGVNSRRYLKLSLYCAQLVKACSGSVTVLAAGTRAARPLTLAATTLNAPPSGSAKITMRLSAKGLSLIRTHHRRLPATLIVRLSGGATYSHAITLKI